jgi:predicted MPP superfamily phosphohydrolase
LAFAPEFVLSPRQPKRTLKRLGRRGLATLRGWPYTFEADRVEVNHYSLSLPHWPADHEPVRIALLGDLHVGAPFMSLEKIAVVVDMIRSQNPDGVVLLGDYVIQGVVGGIETAPEDFAHILGGLSAPLGVFGVLGNHDWWLDGPRVSNALQSAGIEMIDNSALRIERDGGSFWLVGIGDYSEGGPDLHGTLAQVHDEAPAILATHDPDLFPHVPQRVALSVAGHTHGGQVDLPLVGRPAITSRKSERYARGHVIEDGQHYFVTSGLGTSVVPVRFRVAPEIVILTIEGAG